MTMQGRISVALLAAGLSSPAAAQGVDRYEFVQTQKQLQALEQEIGRMRGQLGGGGRIDAVEDEIKRLIGQIERLEFAQRQHEANAKQKLEDLEYRIIELEGGDPSILFQQEETQGGLAPDPATPVRPADPIQPSQPPQGGALGTLNSSAPVSGGERASFDAGVAAVRAGRGAEARGDLEAFLSNYPDSPLVSDAHYWLGEAHFVDGEYRAAAQRFLDGATLNAGASMAPESLLKLGVTLGLLGRQDAACSTLREVRQRYPQAADQVARAEREAGRAGCG